MTGDLFQTQLRRLELNSRQVWSTEEKDFLWRELRRDFPRMTDAGFVRVVDRLLRRIRPDGKAERNLPVLEEFRQNAAGVADAPDPRRTAPDGPWPRWDAEIAALRIEFLGLWQRGDPRFQWGTSHRPPQRPGPPPDTLEATCPEGLSCGWCMGARDAERLARQLRADPDLQTPADPARETIVARQGLELLRAAGAGDGA